MVDLPNVLTGNAADLDTRGTGWILGFSEWTRLPQSDLLHVPKDLPLHGLCVKWYLHPAGHVSDAKPVSEGRTLSLLAGAPSHFQVDFSLDPGFPPEATRVVDLRRTGDFVIWGAGLHHRWRAPGACTIVTVRWEEG